MPQNGFNRVFVFGSNLAGRHGKGAAKTAKDFYGALQGVGSGRQGDSYAIPTKGYSLETLPLSEIKKHVEVFLNYAREIAIVHPHEYFMVTRIGCGLAGYEDGDIAPFFRGAPKNCQLPEGWSEDGRFGRVKE